MAEEMDVEQSPSSILLEVSQLLSEKAKALQSTGTEKKRPGSAKWREKLSSSTSTGTGTTSTAVSSDDDEGMYNLGSVDKCARTIDMYRCILRV